ncbi:MAG: hypothetical protein WEA28_13820 [Xanthobacteraceae bacterium]
MPSNAAANSQVEERRIEGCRILRLSGIFSPAGCRMDSTIPLPDDLAAAMKDRLATAVAGVLSSRGAI